MQTALRRALAEYRLTRLFDRADAAYSALRADPRAWKLEVKERAVSNSTLLDGIESTLDEREAYSH